MRMSCILISLHPILQIRRDENPSIQVGKGVLFED